MGRHLDHDARKEQVIDAAWRVISRDGLAAVTVRNVAQEAGLAASSLRYVFPSQQMVLEASMHAFQGRLQTRVDSLPRDQHYAVNSLLELLPLDADRRLEMEVGFALGSAAITDANLKAWLQNVNAFVRTMCVDALSCLGVTDERLAVELHALVEGLAAQAVTRPWEPSGWTEDALRFYLARLTPGQAGPGSESPA